MTIEKNTLIEQLASREVKVTFTKKDGTERVMLCTRSNTLIPPDHHPKGEVEIEASDNIRVFDLEKQGWRSFNYTSVKEAV